MITAARVVGAEGPTGVRVEQIAEPDTDGDTIVRVAVAGVVMPDVLQSRGLYQDQPALPFTLGCEFAGVVETSGDPRLPGGSRVAGLGPRGAFAEAIRVNARDLLTVPDAMSFELAAALPVNYLTMYYALHARARLLPGDRVLIRGAGGGVGIAAIQLARSAGAGMIVAVASTAEKRALALAQGADEAVSSPAELPRDTGMDVVVDPVGGDGWLDAFRTLRQHGRYLVIGFAAGTIPTVAFNRVLLRNVDLIGVYLGLRRAVAAHEIIRMWNELCLLALRGDIAPVIDSIHPLIEVSTALRVLDERRAMGKVLLQVAE